MTASGQYLQFAKSGNLAAICAKEWLSRRDPMIVGTLAGPASPNLGARSPSRSPALAGHRDGDSDP